jgi:hypothetical protein
MACCDACPALQGYLYRLRQTTPEGNLKTVATSAKVPSDSAEYVEVTIPVSTPAGSSVDGTGSWARDGCGHGGVPWEQLPRCPLTQRCWHGSASWATTFGRTAWPFGRAPTPPVHIVGCCLCTQTRQHMRGAENSNRTVTLSLSFTDEWYLGIVLEAGWTPCECTALRRMRTAASCMAAMLPCQNSFD